MEIIRDIYNIRPRHQGCVITVGNFDGLHLGHQALLERLRAKSTQLKLPSLAIIFEPQPNEYFSPKVSVARLMRFREKVETFEKQGINRVLCLRFNDEMANQTAEVFVRRLLFEKLAVKYILVGDDFKFGYQRKGDYSLLKQLGEKYSFRTECMPSFKLFGARVSSTRIRHLLAEGDLEQATLLLGRSFSMKGRIVHGSKLGRILGFPTANIQLHRKRVPVLGIFAVEMMGVGTSPLPGVANVGTRPTVSGDMRTILEVHLLNFEQNIYGRQVEIQFLHKFREEEKFDSLDELKAQILQDTERAKHYFKV
jgi:riboflavin kinase/FMN adenylyltransferase